jgi:hypothetical protein
VHENGLEDSVCTYRIDSRLHLSFGFHQRLELVDIDLMTGQLGFSDLHPFMVECPLRTHAFARIDGQTLRDQVFGTIRNKSPELRSKVILSISGTIEYCVFIFVVKGKVSTQQQKQNDTDTPHIAFDIVGGPPFQDFGCEVSRGTAECTASISFFYRLGETEISEFDRQQQFWVLNNDSKENRVSGFRFSDSSLDILPSITYRQQQVFWFQISMRHPSFMHIFQGTQYATTTTSGLVFRKCFLFNNPIKEFSPRHEFRHEITVVSFFVDFVQLDNVGTRSDFLQIFDFILERIAMSPKHFGSIDLLNGIFGTRGTMDSNKDNGKGSVTQLFMV